MKNLFEPTTSQEISERMAQLRPDSERRWGTMSPAQAIAHCSHAMEWAVGDRTPPRMILGRIVGIFVKRMILRDDKPMRRNAPTAKDLLVKDERDLGAERQKLSRLLERFTSTGQQECTKHPHSFFGRLTPEEWATLMYKHLDHHLRQFHV